MLKCRNMYDMDTAGVAYYINCENCNGINTENTKTKNQNSPASARFSSRERSTFGCSKYISYSFRIIFSKITLLEILKNN